MRPKFRQIDRPEFGHMRRQQHPTPIVSFLYIALDRPCHKKRNSLISFEFSGLACNMLKKRILFHFALKPLP